MIDTDSLCNIDLQAIELFNKSVYSANDDKHILKIEVYFTCSDNKLLNEYMLYDEKQGNDFYLLWHRFISCVVLEDDASHFSLDDMERFLNGIPKYLDFAIKHDKLIKIKERKQELEKDFV